MIDDIHAYVPFL